MNELDASLSPETASVRSAKSAGCPFDPTRDDRKTAALFARHGKLDQSLERVGDYGFSRELLRHAVFKQDGPGADEVDVGNPEHVPVFYLDGEMHRSRRTAIAKFFLPKSINTRYLAVMESTTDRLVQQFQATGRAKLDAISFELTAAVVSDIVGLDKSDVRKLSVRLSKLLDRLFRTDKGLRRLINKAYVLLYSLQFYFLDVMPAVRARRKQRRDDIISLTLDKGYSDKAIMIECLTYATAGMVTTRELIVMAAWHMFEQPALHQQFIAADEDGQMAVLEEVLRLEPIASVIFRRADEDTTTVLRGKVSAGTKFAIDLRSANTDEALVGACPHALDPERAKRQKQNGIYMSFGDGTHRCPGWQVALKESRVFLDRLMRVPGLRLERAPDIVWNIPLITYELHDAIITCDPVS